MSIAGLFPGQGSQSLGMLAELGASYAVVRETFQEAADVLGRDLWAITQKGPETVLNDTENTQPIMLAAGVATLRAWEAAGGKMPTAVAGHSLGEYTALTAAGVLQFADAVRLIGERSRLMKNAVPEGSTTMAAVLGLDDEQIVAVCAEASTDNIVEAVNFNSPGQVVIAGETVAVDKAITLAKDAGAKKAILLAVSVPSHCALMKPAADALGEHLEATNFQPSLLPCMHNVDGQARATVADILQALTEQLYRPVRWVDTIRNLQNEYGIELMLEFGPGKVLTGLNRRIERRMKAAAIFDNASLEAALKLSEA